MLSKGVIRQLLAAAHHTGDYRSLQYLPPEKLLTPRELDIARAVANGLTLQQTAQQIHVSVKTVEAYKYAMFRKLGFKNSGIVIHWALYHRLVPNLLESKPHE